MEIVIDIDERYPFYSVLTQIPTWRANEVITIPDEDFMRIMGVFEEFEKVQGELEGYSRKG